jgi:hypothetical protein
MMVPQPQDDADGLEPRAERSPLELDGPHGPAHEAALQALLERESGSGQALEWSGNCQQCRDELARLRELGALLDDAAADRRRTLEAARALRTRSDERDQNLDDELVASFVRGKLSGIDLAPRRGAQFPAEVAPPFPLPASRERLRLVAHVPAPAARGPRWQRAWAPWVVSAAGVALVVGWWLRSILPTGDPQGRGVTMSSGETAKIEPEGPVDNYDKFSWDISAPESGSLVLRIWDNSSADSAEALHTIRLNTDQRSWRAENLWKGRGPESIRWQVEALDSTAQFRGATRVVYAQLKPR